MTNVVISLVTYNGEKYLQLCLESIAAQTFQDYELVVLDNASGDSSCDIVARVAPRARIIKSTNNIGFARGHNEVIRQTQSEYVCVLNQDLVLEPDYLERCVHSMDSNPRIGSASGLLLRVPSLTADAPSDTIDTYGIVLSKAMRAKDAGAGMPLASLSGKEKIIGASGTAGLYRRSALEDVAMEQCDEDGCRLEYFDEDFFMYKEDVDLALRLQFRGWSAAAVLDARGYHVRTTDPALFKRPSALINQWSYRNQLYILIKDVTMSHWLKYGVAIGVFEAAKFFYLFIFERTTLRALGDVWKNRKKMFAKRSYIMEHIA